MSVDLTLYSGVDVTNGHVNGIPCLPALPCVSCFVAVLGFILVCFLLIYQGIRLLLWFQGAAFLPPSSFVRFT